MAKLKRDPPISPDPTPSGWGLLSEACTVMHEMVTSGDKEQLQIFIALPTSIIGEAKNDVLKKIGLERKTQKTASPPPEAEPPLEKPPTWGRQKSTMDHLKSDLDRYGIAPRSDSSPSARPPLGHYGFVPIGMVLSPSSVSSDGSSPSEPSPRSEKFAKLRAQIDSYKKQPKPERTEAEPERTEKNIDERDKLDDFLHRKKKAGEMTRGDGMSVRPVNDYLDAKGVPLDKRSRQAIQHDVRISHKYATAKTPEEKMQWGAQAIHSQRDIARSFAESEEPAGQTAHLVLGAMTAARHFCDRVMDSLARPDPSEPKNKDRSIEI